MQENTTHKNIVKKSLFKCTVTGIEGDTFASIIQKFQKEIINLRKKVQTQDFDDNKYITILILDLFNLGCDNPSELMETLNNIPVADAQKFVNFHNKDDSPMKIIFCEHDNKYKFVDTGY